ncbi:MAG: membrane protein insertase YidC, partial [Janthinobacterium sp.]
MDINKRTILWIVFSVSLVILWNEWMISNGKPSMFSANTEQTAKAPVTPAKTAALAAAGATAVPGEATDPAAFKREVITITTDVIKVDIDTLGGQVKRLELLKFKGAGNPGWFGGCFGLFKWCQPDDGKQNEVLFDEGANHTYLAQSGLVGGPFPTHASGFTVQPGVRTIGDGKQVQLVMEAVEGGVKLTKTFTFKRGDYVIDVRHDVSNVGAAPVTPQLYLQLTHDGNKPVGDSFFNSSFTGPTLYTPQDKYQKLTFEKIEKAA